MLQIQENTPGVLEIFGTLFFMLAVLHTFFVQKFLATSRQYPKESFSHGALHFLGEIEVVFGLWSALFILVFAVYEGGDRAISYLESIRFTEPLFVFVIMIVAATKPVLFCAQRCLDTISTGLARIVTDFRPQPARMQNSSTLKESFTLSEDSKKLELRGSAIQVKHIDLFVLLFLGPLLGSVITEPAAITVTALLLREMLHKSSEKFAYAVLAVLFVNISIGGALTPFAAPPILMVAKNWGWDLSFTLSQFGWKAALAIFCNSLLLCFFFRNDIQKSCRSFAELQVKERVPWGVVFVHLIFLFLIVSTAHFPNVFFGVFLLFLGVTTVTQKHQGTLRLRESLLVAFFLAGIMVFGAFQQWWLQPLLAQLSEGTLYLGATLLTAVTDNAALTYLGSQVVGLSDSSKYALVAGAISGGGLTIIANAPNAAGYTILSAEFPRGSLNPGKLFLAALIPTAITCGFLYFL